MLTLKLPKSSWSSFTKIYVFKIAQKVSRHLAYFWKKICRQELSKIAKNKAEDFSDENSEEEHIIFAKLEKAIRQKTGRCKWSGGQRAILLDWRSEFESLWSLQF